MYAVKLENKVDDHDLIIPFEDIRRFNHSMVEIIIIPKNEPVLNRKNNLQLILDKYKDVHPFEDIDDAVIWQQKVRDEWH